MYKVSFIGDFKDVQVFNAKATVVTLTGRFDMPEWWNNIPQEVYDWLNTYLSVYISESWATREVFLGVQGKSLCHADDSFDAILGERIAESRAKYKLYKFMYTLCDKLMKYYFALMYGKESEMSSFFRGNDFNTSLYKITNKYQELMIKESHHIGELLKEV